MSRLGMGTGSLGGRVQRDLGEEGLTKLVRYAFDKGIRYIDTADNYRIHPMVAKAIKDLPREKLFIQSKIWVRPRRRKKNDPPPPPPNPKAAIERFLKELGVEYIDSLLIHCMVDADWDDRYKAAIEAMQEAKEKKLIRAHGFSAHSGQAVARAAKLDWIDVGLLRVNPQGVCIDPPAKDTGFMSSTAEHVQGCVDRMKALHERRVGIIGMKLIGNGKFTKAEDREKAIRFVMQKTPVDAVVIGFKSPAEIDEAVKRINSALADKKA